MLLKCSIIGLQCPTTSCAEQYLETTLCWFGLDIDFSRSTCSEVHSSKYDAGFLLAPLLLLTPAVQTAKHHTAVFLQLLYFSTTKWVVHSLVLFQFVFFGFWFGCVCCFGFVFGSVNNNSHSKKREDWLEQWIPPQWDALFQSIIL